MKEENFEILNIYIEIKVTVWILCAHSLITSIYFHTQDLTLKKTSVRTWFFYFSLYSLFAFWGADKHVFHIAPFRSTSYEINIFWILGVSYHVSNWKNGKNLIFEEPIVQMYQFAIPISIYKLMLQSSLWISVSYVLCECNCVASWNKLKTIILVRLSFQICQLQILVSYST